MLTRSIAAAAILLVGGAVGCSGSSASGPAIQPGAASMSGLALNPATLGVFTAYITATDAQPIMLEKITLLPLPGFRLPHLENAALLEGGTYSARTLTWPPSGAHVRPLAGAVVWPAARQGGAPPEVIYALSADGLGAYATAGLRLEYRFGGRTAYVVIRDAVFLWYFARHLSPADSKTDGAKYLAANARAYRTLEGLAQSG